MIQVVTHHRGSTITIPAGKGGYYLVIGWGYWDAKRNRTTKYENYTKMDADVI
jgi:hypothetical protein